MINLGIVVVDKGDILEVEIPMHKVFLGKGTPSEHFKTHLRHLFEDFEYESAKSTHLLALNKS